MWMIKIADLLSTKQQRTSKKKTNTTTSYDEHHNLLIPKDADAFWKFGLSHNRRCLGISR